MLTFTPSPLPLTLVRDAALGRPPHRSPELMRVHPGVYVDLAGWNNLAPWDRYLARVHAVRLARPGSAFCFESAAALHGLPIFGEPRHVHVLGGWSDATHSTTAGRVAVHQLNGERTVESTPEGSVVSIAETVLDLGRLLPPAFGLAVADAALRTARAGTTAAVLWEWATAQGWRRGIRRLQWVLANADPDAESVGESVSRAIIQWLGYPKPELQRWFHFEGADDRADFYWPDDEVIGESDGYGKYDAADVTAAKQHLIDEKKREDRLRRHVRGFARWDFQDAMHPARLDAKLRDSGLRPVNAPNRAMLATLARNARSLPPAGRSEA